MKTKIEQLLMEQQTQRNVLAKELVEELNTLLTQLGARAVLEGSLSEDTKDLMENIKVLNAKIDGLKAENESLNKTIEANNIQMNSISVNAVLELDAAKQVIKALKESVKELEAGRENDSVELIKLRKELASKPKEVIKTVETNNIEEITKLKAELEAIKKANAIEIEKLKAEAVGYTNALNAANAQVNTLTNSLREKDQLLSMMANVKATAPTNTVNTNNGVKLTSFNVNSDMKILKNDSSYLFGTFKDIPFQTSKTIAGTVVFNKDHYSMKEEIEALLVTNGLIPDYREEKDPVRQELDYGVCHKIDDKAYMGFVHIGTQTHCFVWRFSKDKVPATVILQHKLKNPQIRYEKCGNRAVIDKIRMIVAEHENAEQQYEAELDAANKGVYVDPKQIEMERRAKLAALRMVTGTGKETKGEDTQDKKVEESIIKNTNNNTATNTEDQNANVTTFEDLDFSFGEE